MVFTGGASKGLVVKVWKQLTSTACHFDKGWRTGEPELLFTLPR